MKSSDSHTNSKGKSPNRCCTNSHCIKKNHRVPECVYLSANRFPATWENGIQTSSFAFRSPTPLEKGIWISIFVFRFPTSLKTEFELLFSFFVFSWLSMDHRTPIAISIFRFHKMSNNGIWTSSFVFRFSFPCFRVFVISVFRHFLSMRKSERSLLKGLELAGWKSTWIINYNLCVPVYVLSACSRSNWSAEFCVSEVLPQFTESTIRYSLTRLSLELAN